MMVLWRFLPKSESMSTLPARWRSSMTQEGFLRVRLDCILKLIVKSEAYRLRRPRKRLPDRSVVARYEGEVSVEKKNV